MRQVNLLPLELQNAEKSRMVRNVVTLTLGPTLAVIVLLHLLLAMRVARLEEVAEQPTVQIDTPEINQLRQKVAQSKDTMEAFIQQHHVVVEVLVNNISTTDILRVIGEVTKDKVWLTAFSLDSQKGTCQLKGKSFNTRLVSEFMLELKKMPYFDDVSLVTMGKEAAAGSSEVDFSIICQLK